MMLPSVSLRNIRTNTDITEALQYVNTVNLSASERLTAQIMIIAAQWFNNKPQSKILTLHDLIQEIKGG